jgi:hypothetical protein
MPAIIDLTKAVWIWPEAETPDTWHEITEETYWEFLEMLPPIYAPSGFLMSEAKRHDAKGIAVRAYYVETNGRWFVREVSEARHPEALAEMLALLRPEAKDGRACNLCGALRLPGAKEQKCSAGQALVWCDGCRMHTTSEKTPEQENETL